MPKNDGYKIDHVIDNAGFRYAASAENPLGNGDTRARLNKAVRLEKGKFEGGVSVGVSAFKGTSDKGRGK